MPKNVVHAFRTVVEEVGAHVGFLISSQGLQSGALEAAHHTNIELVSWDEFQNRFFERWFEAMRAKLAPVADGVFEYSDYFHRRTTSVLHAIPERVDELMALHKRFSAYTHATSYMQVVRPNRITFPVQIRGPRTAEMITGNDARAYFDWLFTAAPQAVRAYEEFISKYEEADRAAERAESQ